jgi:hypothetical protein
LALFILKANNILLVLSAIKIQARPTSTQKFDQLLGISAYNQKQRKNYQTTNANARRHKKGTKKNKAKQTTPFANIKTTTTPEAETQQISSATRSFFSFPSVSIFRASSRAVADVNQHAPYLCVSL